MRGFLRGLLAGAALLFAVPLAPALAQNCLNNAPRAIVQTGTSYTIAQTDNCNVVTLTNGSPIAVTLPAPGTGGGFYNNFHTEVFAAGAGTATITPSGGVTINGASTLTVPAAKSVNVWSGTDGLWYASAGGGGTTGAGAFTSLTWGSGSTIGGSLTGGTTAATITATGTNGNLLVEANGSGTVNLAGSTKANSSLQATTVASAVNAVQASGAIASGAPIINVVGTDTNPPLIVTAKGTGATYLGGQGTIANAGLQVANPAGTIVNQVVVTPAATGTAAAITETGDANRNLSVAGAGTGIVALGQTICTITGTTPQICNGQRGIVTTGTLTTAAVTDATFTITNSSVGTTSLVMCTVQTYSGTYSTNGDPIILSCVPGSGSFVVNFRNVHATNALNGALGIGFVVLN